MRNCLDRLDAPRDCGQAALSPRAARSGRLPGMTQCVAPRVVGSATRPQPVVVVGRGTGCAFCRGMAGGLAVRGLVGVAGAASPPCGPAAQEDIPMVSVSRPTPMSLARAQELVAKDRIRKQRARDARKARLAEARLILAREEAGLNPDGTARKSK